MIPELSGLSINRKHHFLRQIFGDTLFMPALPEECNQLRRKDMEERVERIFVPLFQKPFRYLEFPQTAHC